MNVEIPDATGTRGMKMFSSVSRKGTLVFGMVDEAGGRTYRAKANGKAWDPPAPLGAHFNVPKHMGDPFLSPDEDYLIFQAERPGGHGQADFYISYAKIDGSWTHPKNLGPSINSDEFEFGPSLTPDGSYFLFSRRKGWKTEVPSKIYWVKAGFIKRLRHTNFAPYVKTPVPAQAAAVGKVLQFALPNPTFVDDDGNHTLTYVATLEGGVQLPEWLRFDARTLTFSGTPKEKGKLRIQVAATDPAGEKATTMIDLELL